jgi:hypothetical protein
LTPYCGLEVQKPTQALKSVKDPGNTFDINHKWSRTLPSIFEKKLWSGGLYKYPMKNILRTAKFLTTWDFNQRYCPGL